jgi:hypothetical protein
MKIQVTCCEGKDDGNCMRGRCPHYARAKERVQRGWPYIGTGFGNLYGNPSHQNFLREVRENVSKQKPQKPSKSSL